jgi:hypothetical protein
MKELQQNTDADTKPLLKKFPPKIYTYITQYLQILMSATFYTQKNLFTKLN